MEVSGYRAGVARLLQPADLEPLAEPAQIDAVDLAVAGVVHRPLLRVDRSDRSIGDARAEEFRRGERRVAEEERLGEPSGHVVVERQQALDVRHRHGARHAAQIDRRRTPLKPERKRRVDPDRRIARGHARAVGGRGGFANQHLRRGQLAARADIVRRVIHVHRMRPAERIHAARKMAAELEREIECDATGDIRRAVVAIEPAGEVQAIDVDGPIAVPSGHRGVERQPARDRAARSGQPHIRGERVDRALQRRLERGVDRDVPQSANDARPLLKREARRAHLQIQRGRLLLGIDRPVERVRGLRRLNREALEEPAVGAAAERAAQRAHRQIRCVPDPRHAVEVQRPADREVGEREKRIQLLEVGRHVGGAEVERILQRDSAVDHLD